MIESIQLPGREPLRREILAMARMVIDDVYAVRHWYDEDAIHALGGMTAADLVRCGQGARVVAFLLTIAAHERAATPGHVRGGIAACKGVAGHGSPRTATAAANGSHRGGSTFAPS